MLYRWGLATLLGEEAWADLAAADPSRPAWQAALAALVQPSVDARGCRSRDSSTVPLPLPSPALRAIKSCVPRLPDMLNGARSFNVSHRHFSHLMDIWPLKA